MWKLTVKQEKNLGESFGNIMAEQEIEFVDKNQNNLLDLVRYLSECNTPHPTKYSIAPCEEVQ